MFKVVAGMIALNEQDYLRYCLESFYNIVDKIIIVEGAEHSFHFAASPEGLSTDKTPEIIREFVERPEHKIVWIRNNLYKFAGKYPPQLLEAIKSRIALPPNQEARPWFDRLAIDYLDNYLTSNMNILEFGAGGSTVWFSRRVNKVVSVEHDQKYADYVNAHNLNNVEMNVLPRPYNGFADTLQDETFDFILVDGRDRNDCAKSAYKKLKVGALLAWDDAGRAEHEEGIRFLQDNGYELIEKCFETFMFRRVQ